MLCHALPFLYGVNDGFLSDDQFVINKRLLYVFLVAVRTG